MTLSQLLALHEERTGLSKKELCVRLHGMPYRTYMSYRHEGKSPSDWVQGMIGDALKAIPDDPKILTPDSFSKRLSK